MKIMAGRFTRDDVIDAAERVIDKESIDALSARRLASELDVSRQVVYTHFSGMNDVLDAAHRRAATRLVDEVQALDQPAGTDARLIAAAHAYVQHARERPGGFSLMFGQPVPGYRPSPATVNELRAVFGEHIVGLVREWADAQSFDLSAGEVMLQTRLYWSAIHGLVTLEFARHATPAETDTMVNELIETLLSGWRHS